MTKTLYLFLLTVAFQLHGTLKAQQPGQILFGTGRVVVAVTDASPEQPAIQSFLRGMLAKSGIAYADNDSPNFLVHTLVTYGYEKQLDVSGTPLIAAELEFTFEIKDRLGGLSYALLRLPVRESGENTTVLIRNAVRQLNNQSRVFEEFIQQARANILVYYRENCDRLITLAREDLSMERYDACFLALGQIPREVECYEKASLMMMEAHQALLDRKCQILVQEINVLSEKGDFDAAYELSFQIPQNSRCKDELDGVMNKIAHLACDKFIARAEAFYARNDLDKCVDALAGIERLSPECNERKVALEAKIISQIRAEAAKVWAARQQAYQDNLAIRNEALNQSYRLQNQKMAQEDRRIDLQSEQIQNKHELQMARLDKEAQLVAKALEIEPALERYRSRVTLPQSVHEQLAQRLKIRDLIDTYQHILNN